MKYISFILTLCCPLAILPGASTDKQESLPAKVEEKEVLALQAFLPDPISGKIARLCMPVDAIKGADVAFRYGAVPHVTIAAWRVTPEERESAIAKLNSAVLSGIAPIQFSCHLQRETENDTVSWYLIPDEAERPRLDAFRREVLTAVGFGFEDFCGRSGDKWWPHLTLFSVPAADEVKGKSIADSLGTITRLRLSALAIVGFHQGIHTLATAPLEKKANVRFPDPGGGRGTVPKK